MLAILLTCVLLRCVSCLNKEWWWWWWWWSTTTDSEWLTVVRPTGVDDKVSIRTEPHNTHSAFSTTAHVKQTFHIYFNIHGQNKDVTSLIFKCTTVRSQQRTTQADTLMTSNRRLVSRQTTHVAAHYSKAVHMTVKNHYSTNIPVN